MKGKKQWQILGIVDFYLSDKIVSFSLSMFNMHFLTGKLDAELDSWKKIDDQSKSLKKGLR